MALGNHSSLPKIVPRQQFAGNSIIVIGRDTVPTHAVITGINVFRFTLVAIRVAVFVCIIVIVVIVVIIVIIVIIVVNQRPRRAG